MLGIKVNEVQKNIKFNYPFIAVLCVIVTLFSAIYHIVPYSTIIITVSVNLLATITVDLLTSRKINPWVQSISVIILSIVIISTIALAITYFRSETIPVALLLFVPPIILQVSISFAYGLFVVSMVGLAGIGILLFEISDSSHLSYANFFFVYIFLLMLIYLANYIMELLRKKEREIVRISEINRNLYQMSKTTSDEIVSNMTEALVVLDDELKISRYNDAFTLLTGKKMEYTNRSFAPFSKTINLEIKVLADEIIKNKVDGAVSVSTADKENNEYQINIRKLKLKEDKIGFLVLISKKQSPWGKVCESKTGNPIPLAIVRLIKIDGEKVMETKVTNSNGNFAFMAPEGEYRLQIAKAGYVFPSKQESGGYRGDSFHLSTNLVNFTIKLDPAANTETAS